MFRHTCRCHIVGISKPHSHLQDSIESCQLNSLIFLNILRSLQLTTEWGGGYESCIQTLFLSSHAWKTWQPLLEETLLIWTVVAILPMFSFQFKFTHVFQQFFKNFQIIQYWNIGLYNIDKFNTFSIDDILQIGGIIGLLPFLKTHLKKWLA